MFCPRCGNNNENDARFCFSCGHRFAQGAQPAGPSGPGWSQLGSAPPPPPPVPAAPPEPVPMPIAPPPPPAYVPPVQTQIVTPRGPRRGNPALAVAVLAGVAIVVAGAFFLTRDDSKSGSGRSVIGGGVAPAVVETAAPAGTPTRPTIATPAPVIAPGYKLTAIFVPPPNPATPPTFDARLFTAMVSGVFWEDAAKLYNRRFPLQFILNNATTNLLLQRHDPEGAHKLIRDAGFTTSGPKMYLAFNPSDKLFADWLSDRLRGLGYTVVTDPNAFTPEEKAKGYYGLIIDVIPA